ncbi:hypothetical protein Esi_0005_0002 [Ectocarpus siliculosus]|uniref:Uncharacterized protein n=1 Tax=Ectocarpus siliculosus TaxID=2880 RepID=D8LNL2_ECTSI|nr:hypothetical protein Esi_0005_0002 [Ectocarpus siliculosus]|eukprot:CBN78222.1 hypothetical protein Esi_0005_0002 [Ectocarpus siliculosus]
MQAASLSASASSGSLAPPPGLPRSSSTAELVALGFDPSGVMDGGNDLNSSDGGGGGAGYDPRPPAMSGSGSGGGGGGGGGVGGGLDAGDMGGKDDGTGGTGTGSAGGMGLGLRNHSLTNLANMVRSQSVSSFHSEIFASGGKPVRSTAIDSPAWGSYPANLDKMGSGGGGGGGGGGGEDMFTVSPSMGPRGAGRGTLPMRPPTGGGDRGGVGGGGGGGGGDVGGGAGAGADLSPQQFAGRGTAARREVVDRGMSAGSAAGSTRTSQRRPMGGGSSFDPRGMVPSGPGRSGAPPSGRAMVHNRSDTDLVASFSRLGFGQGGVSRWSPLMSPTASPLVGAPLLEEDPLDLELEENASRGAGAGAGGAAVDTFGAPSSFLTSHGRRGLMDGHGASGEAPGMEVAAAVDMAWKTWYTEPWSTSRPGTALRGAQPLE